VKFLTIAGVSAGTMTNGAAVGVVVGRLIGLGVVAGVVGLAGVVFTGAGVLGAGVGLAVGVDLAGGVTVIAGATMPIVRLAAHSKAIAPGLILVSFMVSTSRSISMNYVTISSLSIDYTLPSIAFIIKGNGQKIVPEFNFRSDNLR
jgi:hypothetical protein